MGLLDALGDGIAQGAQSVADQTAQQIAVDRELAMKQMLEQSTLSLQAQAATAARTASSQRFAAAREPLVQQSMLNQAQDEYSDADTDDNGKVVGHSPVTMDDVDAADIARYRQNALNDTSIMVNAGLSTGDISAEKAAEISQKGDTAMIRAQAFIERTHDMLAAAQGHDATKVALVQLAAMYKDSSARDRQAQLTGLNNDMNNAQHSVDTAMIARRGTLDPDERAALNANIASNQRILDDSRDLKAVITGLKTSDQAAKDRAARDAAAASTAAPTAPALRPPLASFNK